MFNTCYGNKVHTVGIAGPSSNIVSSSWSGEMKAGIIVDETWRTITTAGPVTRGTRYKLKNFMVTASTTTSLKETLQDVKNSLWWNHMASFLIIDSPTPLNHGCSKAFNILSTAWKMNILHAKFICQHKSKGPLIYSYNPYTNQAPLPWQMKKTYRIQNEHPWTLLVRGYRDSQEMCKELDFEKTKDLGGYEIRAGVFSVDIDTHSSKLNHESVVGMYGTNARYLFRALNSSSKIVVYEPSYPFSDLIARGVVDIKLEEWYQQNEFNSTMTYPHGVSGLESITQHRGYRSQIGKLLLVLDYSSRYAVFIVFCVTFIFFKFFLRRSVTSAFLHIILLICNTALPNLPNNVARRIYLGCLFIFMVNLQAIYQGQLASLLTKQVALPNVDTVQDLEKFNYTVYTHKTAVRYFEEANFRGRVVPLEELYCKQYVLRDKSAACVEDWWYFVDTAATTTLHLSNDMSMNFFLVYLIRDDWPVEERLNILISRLFEANIFENVRLKKPNLLLSKMKNSEQEEYEQKFQVITLQELAFAFSILGVGLVFSAVVFIVEVLTEKISDVYSRHFMDGRTTSLHGLQSKSGSRLRALFQADRFEN